jgi:hypothetical protein
MNRSDSGCELKMIQKPRIDVLIPAWNEEKALPFVLAELSKDMGATGDCVRQWFHGQDSGGSEQRQEPSW